MRKVAKWLGGILLTLICCAVMLWWSVLPPAPSAVPAKGGVLRNVTLIVPGVSRQTGVTVNFDEGIITSIEDTGGDGSDGYVIPGLMDMHVHQSVSQLGFEEYFALLYLMHGVTTVRDMGYSYPQVFERRARIEAGEFPGPRIFTCGNFLDGSPPLWEDAFVVESATDAESAVTRLVAEGADCIKVYSNLKADALAAIRNAATKAGLPVIGHVPFGVSFEDAQLEDVQHMIGVPDQAHLPAGSNPFAKGWNVMSPERADFIIETSLARGTAHTPTLVFMKYNALRDDPAALREESGASYLPRMFADLFWQPEQSFRLGGTASPELYAEFRRGFAVATETVGKMHARGVKLHAGTDTGNPFIVPGISLQQELTLMVEAGLTAEQALAAATTVPGEFLREPGLGQLERGAPADMLVLAQDPTVSLEALASLRQVVAGGRVYEYQNLQREVERYRAHFHNFAWDRVVPAIAASFAD